MIAPVLTTGTVSATESLHTLEALSLESLARVSLLDRVDRKYLIETSRLADFYSACHPTYAALDIGGARRFAYSTLYFDTVGFQLYRDHMVGKPRRCKIRVRDYVDSRSRFLEAKIKAADGRTSKLRLTMPFGGEPDPSGIRHLLMGAPFAALPLSMKPDDLRPAVGVAYQRTTLASQHTEERITIDTALSWWSGGQRIQCQDLAVVEVKQNESMSSPVLDVLRRLGARQVAISKYCVGLAVLAPELPAGMYRHLARRMGLLQPEAYRADITH